MVTGNKVTRDRVILRELTAQEGDTLSAEELQAAVVRSRENLLNTGLFNTVVVLPVYLNPQEAFVQVEVNERWYLWPRPSSNWRTPTSTCGGKRRISTA
ncbi:MAG: hypothetical protein IPO12_13780 [Flavobacteriales bacterium]|nr:hypothetical protein [Flavobacteriales bacterium]